MRTFDHLKVMIDDSRPATKSASPQAWAQQQLARRDRWEADQFELRLQQILTPAELQQVKAAGLGTKSELYLAEPIARKINGDPVIKSIMARANKR